MADYKGKPEGKTLLETNTRFKNILSVTVE